MNKIKNIEFLRIIGCIAIILLHLFWKNRLDIFSTHIHLYAYLDKVISNSNKAVDLFFILSGFFFALKLNKTQSILSFLWEKITRLWPVAMFVCVVSFIFSLFNIIEWSFYDNLLALLCLECTNLVVALKNVYFFQFWYVSVMLWVMALYFYLIKYFDKKYVNLIIALLVYFSYSFIISATGGKIHRPGEVFFIIFKTGMLRGIAGIGLGYFIAEWYKDNIEFIKNIQLQLWQKFIVTVIEFCCLFFIINNLIFHKLKFRNDIIFIIAFLTIIVLFLIQKGWISRFLNNTKIGDISAYLAKYTYSVYMIHILVYTILKNTLWNNNPNFVIAHPILNLSLTLGLVFLFGALTYHLVEKPCTDYFKNKAEMHVAVGGGVNLVYA